jgi:hypothetical protein
MENTILSEIPNQFQNAKNRMGALLDAFDDIVKANVKNQKKKSTNLTETYSRIEGIGNIVGGAVKTFTK